MLWNCGKSHVINVNPSSICKNIMIELNHPLILDLITGTKTSHHGLPWGVGYLLQGPAKGTIISNSGDTLKLLIPSSIWKYICGWIFSGVVIIQKILEKVMGNRGSKSVMPNKGIIVKEQRVDGISLNQKSSDLGLRCILLGFEKNFWVRILSKQINKERYYTVTSGPITNSLNISPWFFTGFADAEGSFSILMQANSKYATGWRVKPLFTIGLNKRDMQILKDIQSFLGVGKIHVHGKESIQYRVDSIKELQVIINHFENYPLITAKWSDYILFKKAFDLILLKEHLSKEGLLKLVGIKSHLNLGLSKALQEAFTDWKELAMDRPLYIFNSIPNPFWMAGFASGDSSFNIKTSISSTSLMSKRVQLRFGIGLNIREKALILHLPAYFGIQLTDKSSGLGGASLPVKNVYLKDNVAIFEVVKFSDITDKIIPFFENYPIQGQKSLDLLSFIEAAVIIQSKDHLTSKGLEKILDLKAKMNKY
uniref:LAGLIDADG endonuclease n=1 Tax=Ophiognomonia clavigignenti-juglandacearum TaxID=218668 RepID=A0A2C9DSE7_9PEZI|nr:LAGLIDADG endonuclease [Ophiognomonia clavigignenti-juglandacearum]